MSTVVAIDGPAGAGKSTVARLLAKRMSFAYVNTGSLYRALAWAALRDGLDPSALPDDFLAAQNLEFRGEDLFLNGQKLESELRRPECASGASVISTLNSVRDFLLPVQRNSAKNCWIVMEGRDIGTVIFPDARFKFFVTASPEERAKRRMNQSGEVSSNADFKKILEEIKIRDQRDSSRAIAPLKQADDAILIDTTGMSIDDVVGKMAEIIESGK